MPLRLMYVLCIIVSLAASTSRAELITFGFGGSITDGNVGPIGSRVTLTYTFDSAAVDANPDPHIGFYDGLPFAESVFELKVNGAPVFLAPRNLSPRIGVTDNLDADSYFVSVSGFFGGARLVLTDPTQTAFSSDALPLTLAPLSKFSDRTLGWFFGDAGGSDSFVAEIDSFIVVRMAEPGMLSLLLAALCLLVTVTLGSAMRAARCAKLILRGGLGTVNA